LVSRFSSITVSAVTVGGESMECEAAPLPSEAARRVERDRVGLPTARMRGDERGAGLARRTQSLGFEPSIRLTTDNGFEPFR
jgi:hypothetical protein